jgi:DNA-binding HxlR family transcriptional regulator
VPDFRYPQFCPLARAAEILGERWNLLVLRQLTIAPRRFSDLRRQLGSVSPSVLSERLSSLEAARLIKHTEVERPVPGSVYELDDAGLDLVPILDGLSKWGARYLFPPRPGDKLDPEWFQWFLAANPKVAGPPSARIELRMTYDGKERCIQIEIGDHPSVVSGMSDESDAADVVVSGESMIVAGVASGFIDPQQSADSGLVCIKGEAGLLTRFNDCFELGLPLPSSTENPLDSGGD